MIFVRDAVRFIPVGVFQLVQSGRTKLVYFANQSAYYFISTKRAFLTCHAVYIKAIIIFFFVVTFAPKCLTKWKSVLPFIHWQGQIELTSWSLYLVARNFRFCLWDTRKPISGEINQ